MGLRPVARVSPVRANRAWPCRKSQGQESNHMRLGAHVSSAGDASNAIGRAQEIGAEAIQIFASSPRAWKFRPIQEEQAAAFRESSAAAGGLPAFLHGSYLVNIAAGPDLLRKSIDSLVNHMGAASQLGAVGVIFHCGSHKSAGFDAVKDAAAAALAEVIASTPDDAYLILENSAGMGSHLGASFEEIGLLMELAGSSRVKVCLDTQHAFAAGYRLADPQGIDEAMRDFDSSIGLANLVAVHANDSKVDFGSGVDRHENIGQGFIGLDGFRTIMGHEAFGGVPFLLEVPGDDRKGPDKPNLDRLKAIRDELGLNT